MSRLDPMDVKLEPPREDPAQEDCMAVGLKEDVGIQLQSGAGTNGDHHRG